MAVCLIFFVRQIQIGRPAAGLLSHSFRDARVVGARLGLRLPDPQYAAKRPQEVIALSEKLIPFIRSDYFTCIEAFREGVRLPIRGEAFACAIDPPCAVFA